MNYFDEWKERRIQKIERLSKQRLIFLISGIVIVVIMVPLGRLMGMYHIDFVYFLAVAGSMAVYFWFAINHAFKLTQEIWKLKSDLS